jgi:cytochrome c oxidase assembly protein subunit 15
MAMLLRKVLYGVLLFLQGALVITGGAVRLTGSGLGCPTWPECTDGSYIPVANQAEGQLHAWIEFGNRLLTFALVISALVVLIHVLYTKRRDLRLLALGQVLGILGQGVLGGITVLTDLHPLPVASHLLLSIILIAGATSLYSRRNFSAVQRMDIDRTTRNLSRVHILVTFLVIALGTVVTGSGPHAGDEDARRFGFEIRGVATLHAEAVIALLGITLALFVSAKKYPEIVRAIIIFTIITLAQGVLGYIQYFTGIPEILVGFHLLGAVLVWIAAWRIRILVLKKVMSK